MKSFEEWNFECNSFKETNTESKPLHFIYTVHFQVVSL